ncbi:hypothetical protein SAMN05421505_10915 [Sinosporangium album]|uniref:Uncharacterized protein n=1 Tax=Sinosporangium album TaxID=504805 RepID=A0A1G7XWW3_9ACTN|nr:hypothetical protein [Sinosporangium album]SDG88685.1 hypothetical protein SAMN05421505_10915 [Sinosporangium album]
MNPANSVAAVTPGVLGFLVIAAIAFALFLLIKSMNRHIARIEVPSEADFKKKRKENGGS